MSETEKLRKGFNAGYVLEQHNPELTRLLHDSMAESSDPYAQGFIKGSRQYVQDSLHRSAGPHQGDTLDIDHQTKERNLERDDKDSDITHEH